jgi:hypothetical protein
MLKEVSRRDVVLLKKVMCCAERLPSRSQRVPLLWWKKGRADVTAFDSPRLRTWQALGHGSARVRVRHVLSRRETEIFCEPVLEVREPRPTKYRRVQRCSASGLGRKRRSFANPSWTFGSLGPPNIGVRKGAARHSYGENANPLLTFPGPSGVSPYQIGLGPRFNQRLLLLDQLLPILAVFWFVAVILEVGHFAAQGD